MNTTFADFDALVRQQRDAGSTRFVVPVVQRLSADLLTPVSAFLALRDAGSNAFLLESVEGGERAARYSFLGKNPYRVVTAREREVTVREGRDVVSHLDASVFDVLGDLMDAYDEVTVSGLPRLTGGAVGFLGYDCVRLVEHLPDAPDDDLGLPDAVWCFYDALAAFDHVKHQILLIASVFVEPETETDAAYLDALEKLRALERDLQRPFATPDPVLLAGDAVRSNRTREDFRQAVETAKEYIYEGDIFQVVLSQRFQMRFRGDRFNLYRALRQVNPSPYLYFLDFDDLALVGSSPEVLVRVEDGQAHLMPIAGTRPRGDTPEADAALEADLLADPKERAEHLMLVDLGRNDLGRISDTGTVHVDRYAFIERYSHVMHIVSEVSGRVRDDVSALEVAAAAFPAGTLTGAPKVRAMQIIDALEPSRRGPYGGAVGYVDFSGNLDLCIAIRTMVVTGDRIFVQAGAGVVADSDADREFEETENKARALQHAIRLAAEGLF